jgi:type IV pilus assembly protein PilP
VAFQNNNNKYKMLKKAQYSSVIFMAVVALSGCTSNEMEELDSYIASVHSRPAKPIKPIPAIKPYLRYVYPQHDKDPFDMSILSPVVSPAAAFKVIDKGLEIDTSRIPEFLEGFPLDSLQMVGTVNRKGEQWALIKIPDGGIQRVKKGNYIGNNYGKIVSIEETKIAIKEIVPNGFGGFKERSNAIVFDADSGKQ